MAACHDALRLQVRQTTSDQVVDLNQSSAQVLVKAIGAMLKPTVSRSTRSISPTPALPKSFIQSQEMQRLSVLQRKEQTEDGFNGKRMRNELR